MEWLVKNAVNRDVERQHLNKILQDIKATIEAVNKELTKIRMENNQQDIQSIVGAMVEGNVERGIGVSYNPQKKTLDFIAKDFTISLQGDVTGEGTVTGLGSVTIDTSLANDPSAPNDGEIYWQHNGEWEIVLPSVTGLQYLEGSGILVHSESPDSNGYEIRTIEGTVDEIDVTNGDGVLANPVISLADLADIGGGTFKLIVRDSKGRLLGTSDGTAADVPYDNTASGLTAENLQDAVDEIVAEGVGGGILPVVTGEIVSDQPVFVYADDGSLIYTEIM